MRLKGLEAILYTAPCISAEAFMEMKRTDTSPLSQSRARFTELRRLGVIKEVGVRQCKISGRRSIVWDLTDSLPVYPEIPKDERPKGLKRSIEYIVKQMDKRGWLYVTVSELSELLKNG